MTKLYDEQQLLNVRPALKFVWASKYTSILSLFNAESTKEKILELEAKLRDATKELLPVLFPVEE
jgi:hypothetical protein